MIPVLSSTDIPAAYVYRVRRRTAPLVDFEQGGIAVSDPSAGLQYQLWTAQYDGASILVGPDGGTLAPALTVADVTRVGLAFDQNMRTHLAYTVGGNSFLWWFDSVAGSMATMSIPGVTDVCLTLDDHREQLVGISDVILAYTRSGNLYARVQQDRFQIERLLRSAVEGDELTAIGMNTANRLQFRFLPE